MQHNDERQIKSNLFVPTYLSIYFWHHAEDLHNVVK